MLGIRDILVRIRMRFGTLVHLHTSFFKDKKSEKSYKTVEIKVFLTFFAWWWKDPEPDPYLWVMTNQSTESRCRSGRAKNIRIRMQIRMRIRIPSTDWLAPQSSRLPVGPCLLSHPLARPPAARVMMAANIGPRPTRKYSEYMKRRGRMGQTSEYWSN